MPRREGLGLRTVTPPACRCGNLVAEPLFVQAWGGCVVGTAWRRVLALCRHLKGDCAAGLLSWPSS